MIDAIPQFRDAIRAAGLEPPDVIEPGKIHRFPGVGKQPGNTAGWCKFFDDGLGGCFGDWSSGLTENWQAKHNKPFSQSERASLLRHIAVKKRRAAHERHQKHNAAKVRALLHWNGAIPAQNSHPYLIRKGIKPHGARVHKDSLMLPVWSEEGICSLQFIGSDGSKRLLAGGRKKECFIPVAGITENPSRIVICEGWATGCTLAEDEPHATVLAAIDAGNLKPVALVARRCWPSAELVIAGDDDRLTASNPGATKARAAAIASGALLALPEWPEAAPNHLTDFNDLATWLAGSVA